MALTTSYLQTNKNIEPFFNSLITARAPEKFTIRFLESLEFKSTNDRLFIAVLKGLGFLDESGTPTQRYFDFLDQTRSREIMSEAIKEAYEDLFNINTEAYKLSEDEVKAKFKTLTQGQFSNNIISNMAKTFVGLCNYASWVSKKTSKSKESIDNPRPEVRSKNFDDSIIEDKKIDTSSFGVHYNIQIHLPATRDTAVYEAIFKSLKDHLI